MAEACRRIVCHNPLTIITCRDIIEVELWQWIKCHNPTNNYKHAPNVRDVVMMSIEVASITNLPLMPVGSYISYALIARFPNKVDNEEQNFVAWLSSDLDEMRSHVNSLLDQVSMPFYGLSAFGMSRPLWNFNNSGLL